MSNQIELEQVSLSQSSPSSSLSQQYALSSTQLVIWFDQMLHPDSSLYNIGFVMTIEGELNETLFMQAITATLRRHDALRISFVETLGLPYQKIADVPSVSLERVDLTADPDAQSKATESILNAFQSPFSSHGDLLRTTLLKIDKKRWYWRVCYHHRINDGIGIKLMYDSVMANYSCLLHKLPLPTAAPSYMDFLQGDQAYLNSASYEKDRQFWLQRYAVLPSAILAPVHGKGSMQSEKIVWSLDQTFSRRWKVV